MPGRVRVAGDGEWRTLVARHFAPASERQRGVRAGCIAPIRRSSLRADCPAMLGLVARRITRCAHCVRCARTDATSMSTRRAARAATSPALLGASKGRCSLPARPFAARSVAGTQAAAAGPRDRGHPAAAIWGAPRSEGPRSARAPRALREPTRRICPSAANAVSAASYAARPRPEHRRAAGAQRRPLPHEPLPGAPCRDAPMQCAASSRLPVFPSPGIAPASAGRIDASRR